MVKNHEQIKVDYPRVYKNRRTKPKPEAKLVINQKATLEEAVDDHNDETGVEILRPPHLLSPLAVSPVKVNHLSVSIPPVAKVKQEKSESRIKPKKFTRKASELQQFFRFVPLVPQKEECPLKQSKNHSAKYFCYTGEIILID